MLGTRFDHEASGDLVDPIGHAAEQKVRAVRHQLLEQPEGVPQFRPHRRFRNIEVVGPAFARSPLGSLAGVYRAPRLANGNGTLRQKH